MGEVASTVGLQTVVGVLARSSAEDFDLREVLRSLLEAVLAVSGARGAAVEIAEAGVPAESIVVAGLVAGSPRRLPIISEGKELGFLALYGTAMFGPATADRTQFIADLAGVALARAERQAARSVPIVDDARYRLINGVGLNLRNTLGAAMGYIQLVEMEGTLNFTQREYASRSRRAVTAAVSLISDLLELTRADAGKLSFDRGPVNLNAVAREAARKYQETAGTKRVVIDVEAELKSAVIITDSSYVQQIVDVMVYNAVRYTKPDTSVGILVDIRPGRRAGDPVNWLCVSVRDHGAGLPDAEKVFEEVHRVEQAKGNVRFKLAICRRIARLLGGDMTVESPVNDGSTFTLWLPSTDA